MLTAWILMPQGMFDKQGLLDIKHWELFAVSASLAWVVWFLLRRSHVQAGFRRKPEHREPGIGAEPRGLEQQAGKVKTDVDTVSSVGKPVRSPGATDDSADGVSLLVASEDLFAGFAHAQGILRLEGDELLLEYQIEDDILGVIRSGVKKASIPLAEVAAIRVKPGLRKIKLTILTSTLSALVGVPGMKAGQVTLNVSSKHKASVGPFIEQLKQKLPAGTIEGYQDQQRDGDEDIDSPIHGPAKAMQIGGAVMLGGIPLAAIPLLVDSGVVHSWRAGDWGVNTILLTILLVTHAAAVPVSALVLTAAANMKRRQGYRLAVVGGILLLLPLNSGVAGGHSNGNLGSRGVEERRSQSVVLKQNR